MFRIGKGKVERDAGFTLIEVVCVLAIMSLLTAIVWPARPSSISRPQLERIAVDAVSLLKADLAAALRAQSDIATEINDRLLRSGSDGRQLIIPSNVTLHILWEGACRSASAIIFDASGHSCGRRLELAGSHYKIDLLIDPVTGAIELAASP